MSELYEGKKVVVEDSQGYFPNGSVIEIIKFEDEKTIVEYKGGWYCVYLDEFQWSEVGESGYEQRLEDFIKDRVLVYLSKNRDYGDSFTISCNKHGDKAFIIRAEDKTNRIESLLTKDRTVQDESVRDSILDLFNYSAMFKHWEDKHDMKEGYFKLQGLIDIMEWFVEGEFDNFFDYIEQYLDYSSEVEDMILDVLVAELK